MSVNGATKYKQCSAFSKLDPASTIHASRYGAITCEQVDILYTMLFQMNIDGNTLVGQIVDIADARFYYHVFSWPLLKTTKTTVRLTCCCSKTLPNICTRIVSIRF